MDRIVKIEFKNKLPLVLLKTITQTITKAVIEASMSSKDELLGIGAELYNILTSRADVRSWVSLPKNFQTLAAPGAPAQDHHLAGAHLESHVAHPRLPGRPGLPGRHARAPCRIDFS